EEGIPVGKPLRAAAAVATELGAVPAGPYRFGGAEGGTGPPGHAPATDHRQKQQHQGPNPSATTVIDSRKIARPRQSHRDPLGRMHDIENGRSRHAVIAGLAPAVKDAAALAALASGFPFRFRRGGAVINYDDFAENPRTEGDQVFRGVVTDAVDMHPIPASESAAETASPAAKPHADGVGPVRALGGLDQMIPGVPFPDDSRGLSAGGRRDFDDVVGPNRRRAVHETQSRGLGRGLDLPGDGQDIAVGQGLDIVMGHIGGTPIVEFPDHGSILGDFLDGAMGGRAGYAGFGGVLAAQEIAVVEQIDAVSAALVMGPGMDGFLGAFVQQVGRAASHLAVEDVTGISLLGRSGSIRRQHQSQAHDDFRNPLTHTSSRRNRENETSWKYFCNENIGEGYRKKWPNR